MPGVHIDQCLPWGCCENYKNRHTDVIAPARYTVSALHILAVSATVMKHNWVASGREGNFLVGGGLGKKQGD